MSQGASTGAQKALADTIFLIRHGEKPADTPPPYGVDADGAQDDHSLSTRGWQRAGALVTLFAPLDKGFRPGFASPTRLVAPVYTDAPPANERTHQTIHPLRHAVDVPVETPCQVGDEETSKLAENLTEHAGITLVCWEHKGLEVIAKGICPKAAIPKWDGSRFDVVWVFTGDPNSGTYTFEQVPQLLLPGDSSQPMAQPEEQAPQSP
jgi:hypothetical protein